MYHVWQDPVYGKGKLGEIQGLILGMLDTFNYEQVTNAMQGSANLADLGQKTASLWFKAVCQCNENQ